MVTGIEAFGIVSGAVGLFSFFEDKMPDPPENEGAKVQIKIGNPGAEGDDDTSPDGDIANLYAWGYENDYQGKTTGKYIGTGGIEEFTIDAKVAGDQSGYIGVSADTDAACIAWITVTQYKSQKDAGGRWTGDVGYHCGRSWHYNNQIAGKTEDGEDFRPHCTWLDADHSGNLEDAALKFDVQAYGDKTEDMVNDSKVCDSTLWGPDNGPINAAPGKRSLKPRTQKMKDVLVVSDISTQSARELCESETSHGWDFIGPDGLFCDMEDHTLHTLCSHENVDGCINLDEEGGARRLTRRSIVKRSDGFKRATDSVAKEYQTVAHW